MKVKMMAFKALNGQTMHTILVDNVVTGYLMPGGEIELTNTVTFEALKQILSAVESLMALSGGEHG